jgi:hypothetical protein
MQVFEDCAGQSVQSRMHRRTGRGEAYDLRGSRCAQTVAVALADGGKRGEVREHGKIFNTPAALAKLASKLGQGGRKLKFCYEAGPRGYGIQRQLSAAGYECIVVAPSLIPTRAGDRIKTDRLVVTGVSTPGFTFVDIAAAGSCGEPAITKPCAMAAPDISIVAAAINRIFLI